MKKEIKIGLVAVAGLVLLFFGMNYLKGMNIFSTDTKYYLSFKDISGLTASSPIYADGFKVGVVKSINYDYEKPGNIKIEAGIDPSLHIPEGSTAEIVSDLLGNVQVNLLLADNVQQRLAPGGLINGDINDGALGRVKEMIPAIEKLLPKLDSIMGSLNAILADPAIGQSLHNIRTVTGDLTKTTREVNELLAQLNKNVPGLMNRANTVLVNTNTLTGNLAAINVAGTMEKVNETLDNVEKLTSQLNNTEGSIGLLLRDPSLYQNLNATMRDADSLLVNMKAHPKRYVHFSLFGRKDK
ncbi:MAG: MCE family protein [Prevotella sp.]|nr:MCE family protein [Prevotella sp.]